LTCAAPQAHGLEVANVLLQLRRSAVDLWLQAPSSCVEAVGPATEPSSRAPVHNTTNLDHSVKMGTDILSKSNACFRSLLSTISVCVFIHSFITNINDKTYFIPSNLGHVDTLSKPALGWCMDHLSECLLYTLLYLKNKSKTILVLTVTHILKILSNT
jgi:hypothetical protein